MRNYDDWMLRAVADCLKITEDDLKEQIKTKGRMPIEDSLDILHYFTRSWQERFHEQELILHRLADDIKSIKLTQGKFCSCGREMNCTCYCNVCDNDE